MGARIAIAHAARFSSTTRAMVLIDPARGGSRREQRRGRLALALQRTYATREEAIERFRFLPESSHADEAIRLYVAERSIQVEPDGRFGYKFDPRWFGIPSRPRPDPGLVLCPSLLVRGGESPLLSAEAATEFVSQLVSGRLIEIPDAGHHVLIDQPDRLLDVLEDFIGCL